MGALKTTPGVVIVLGAFALGAQQQAPQQRPPVFRGESVLVTVDAYPQRDGKIIEGLTAKDFQILEDGKPQTVETVEFVRVEPVLSESERRDPGGVGEMLKLAADPHNRVFVVFLDQLHVTLTGSHATRRPMVDALNRIIGPNDLFGVMTQNTDPRALTLGRRLISVEEQLTKHWTWAERYRAGLDITDPWEETLKACFEFKPVVNLPPWYISDNGQRRFLYELLVDRRREDRTLTALEKVVDHLGSLREARTVALVVTEGWRLFTRDQGLADEIGVLFEAGANRRPAIGSSGGRVTLGDQTANAKNTVDYQACSTELVRLANLENDRRLRELTTRANRANVSFYPVNPSGLQSWDTPMSVLVPPSPAEDARRLRNRGNAVADLASATDGIAISTNDLAAGLKRIIDDVSAYYLLGYYSSNTTHDGRYRRIEVKAKPPGVNVRARRGYYAPSNKPLRAGAFAAPAVPEPPQGLDAVLGELGRLRPSADLFMRGVINGEVAHVVVEIPASRVGGVPWSSGADVQVIATQDDAAVLPAVTGSLRAGRRGVLLSVPIGAKVESLRVIAKMSAGGEMLEDTLEIKRIEGDLVGEPIIFRGAASAVIGLSPVANMQFRRIERVHVEWPVTGELDQQSARLLSKNGQPLAVPVAVTVRETDGRRVVAADLNLAPLSAGDFVIELTVGRGTNSVVRLVAFRVVP